MTSVLVPIELEKQENYVLQNEKFLEDSRKLVEEIEGISLRVDSDQQVQAVLEEIMPQQDNIDYRDAVKPLKASYTISTNPVVIREQEKIKGQMKRLFDIDVSEDFFNLGSLSKTEYSLEWYGG